MRIEVRGQMPMGSYYGARTNELGIAVAPIYQVPDVQVPCDAVRKCTWHTRAMREWRARKEARND
jgi:hypothetical protein